MILKKLYETPEQIVVTAHRGFSGRYPENTIPAFLAAKELGAHLIEFDVRGTKDDVPIILHDATFERTANQPGKPIDYLLSEIKHFEASFWSGSHFKGKKLAEPSLPGTKVPTFEEVLQQVGDGIGLNIQVYDTSPHILKKICHLYHDYDLYERGYLSVPDFEVARCVRELNENIEICVLNRQGKMDIESLREQKEFGCHYVQPLQKDVTEEFCHAVKEMNLYANMFYSNTKEDNLRYIELGLQGILTDHPDILIDTIENMCD
ncbi:MAG: hypothetical protein COA79_19185 [Planctomycetota bacterium]|nr:MAG: hypothetical protein COA79_19185 [Planctomycetota bacterium]